MEKLQLSVKFDDLFAMQHSAANIFYFEERFADMSLTFLFRAILNLLTLPNCPKNPVKNFNVKT